jgi:hypothetical protein
MLQRGTSTVTAFDTAGSTAQAHTPPEDGAVIRSPIQDRPGVEHFGITPAWTTERISITVQEGAPGGSDQ